MARNPHAAASSYCGRQVSRLIDQTRAAAFPVSQWFIGMRSRITVTRSCRNLTCFPFHRTHAALPVCARHLPHDSVITAPVLCRHSLLPYSSYHIRQGPTMRSARSACFPWSACLVFRSCFLVSGSELPFRTFTDFHLSIRLPEKADRLIHLLQIDPAGSVPDQDRDLPYRHYRPPAVPNVPCHIAQGVSSRDR